MSSASSSSAPAAAAAAKSRARGQSLVKRPPPAALKKDGPAPATLPPSRAASSVSSLSTDVVPTATAAAPAASERVRAVLRIRPFLEEELASARASGVELHPHFAAVTDTSVDLHTAEATSTVTGRHIAGHESVELDGVIWSVAPDQAPVPDGIARGVGGQGAIFETAVAPLAQSIVAGRNACVLGVGYPRTGRSHTLWGKVAALQRVADLERELEEADIVTDATSAEIAVAERDAAFGVALRAITAIFDQLRAAAATSANRQSEVTLCMGEILADKCKDLLSRDPRTAGAYTGVALRNHPTLGPSLDGLTKVPIASSADAQREVLRALRVHAAGDASSAAQVVLLLDVQQTDMVTNSTDGKTMPVVRQSRLSVVDTGAWGRGGAAAAVQALRRVVDALLSSQAQPHVGTKRATSVVPFRDSLLTSLLAGPLGGACQTVVIGTASPHFAHADDTAAVVRFLQRVRGVTNVVKQNGGTANNLMMDLKEEIARLRRQLDTNGGGSAGGGVGGDGSNDDVTNEIRERENALSLLQATTNRAVEKYEELRRELQLSQTRTKELEAQRAAALQSHAAAAVALGEEKQKAFAQAFKNAFQTGKQTMERRAQEAEASKQIKALREQLEHMRTQLVAVKGERDRFQFEAMKHDKELKRVRVELHAAQMAGARMQKELNQAIDTNEALETKLNLARFESTNEAHDLRSKVLKLERERDEALFDADARKKELRGLRLEIDRVAAEARSAVDSELKDLRVTLRSEQEHNRALASELLDVRDANARLESQVTELRAEAEHARRDFETKTEALDRHHAREQEKLLKVKEAHSIEREAYLNMIAEGLALVADLRQVEALIVSRPTLHRSGWAGVVAWLHSLGLDHLASAFEREGFTDMTAVANIQEVDLAHMKVLSGTRRKLLAAAEKARRDMAAAAARAGIVDAPSAARTTNTTSPSPSPRPSTAAQQPQRSQGQSTSPPPNEQQRSVRAVLDELYDWCNDFRLAIEAEAEAAAQATLQRQR